jgi:hypothetical protein
MKLTLRLGSRIVILAPRIGDVELREHVARWQDHLLHIGRVPSRKNQAAVIRIGS